MTRGGGKAKVVEGPSRRVCGGAYLGGAGLAARSGRHDRYLHLQTSDERVERTVREERAAEQPDRRDERVTFSPPTNLDLRPSRAFDR